MTRWIKLLGRALIAAGLACRSATMPAPQQPPEADSQDPLPTVIQPALPQTKAAPSAAQIEAVSQTVRTVLGRQLQRPSDQIEATSRLEADLGMNAYDQAMMRLELEEHYNIILPSQGLDTVGSLATYIARELP